MTARAVVATKVPGRAAANESAGAATATVARIGVIERSKLCLKPKLVSMSGAEIEIATEIATVTAIVIEIEIGIATVTAIVIEIEIRIVTRTVIGIRTGIGIETGIDFPSTTKRPLSTKRAPITTMPIVEVRTTRAMKTGCTLARTMLAADRATTHGARTFLRAAPRDTAHAMETKTCTAKRIVMAFCAATKRAIVTGNAISSAALSTDEPRL
jgi:hypothetical protein